TFGVGAASPDGDALFSWLSRVNDRLYFLQHRGASHSLLGALVMGLAAAGLLALLARAWPRRLGLFAFRPALLAAGALGAGTHIVLDYVTLSGVPLLWPFSDARVSAEVFHWLVAWLF